MSHFPFARGAPGTAPGPSHHYAAVMGSLFGKENLQLLQIPTPERCIDKTADGGRFQWKGEVASDGAMKRYHYINLYNRQRNKSGKLELVCNQKVPADHIWQKDKRMPKQLLASLLCLALVSAQAVEALHEKRRCTSTPCANTATGEDPSEIAEREGRARLEQIRQGTDDKVRWKRIRLYSDSTDPKRLEMMVHSQSAISMSLAPQSGNLSFRSPAVVHTFNVAAPGKGSDNPCPVYNLQVVDASDGHAVVKKSCPKFEYKPGREYKSYEYYLYDLKTASMREIWSALAIVNASQLVAPTPEPTVSVTSNGYQFKWTGFVSQGEQPTNRAYNLAFVREADKKGNLKLVCRDLAAPKAEHAAGGCEGAGLPLQALTN